ncbi:TA system VapC family ribonuclease toxin [Deinococcus aluminii]|uniref:Ribonuclease VapC n=1 Tax=Deinococcus aluminii TaxID=1656885 RepID=A0ABP9XDQ6_9DEIO
MSFLLDANVLLYAFNRDAVQHAAFHSWLWATLDADTPVFSTALNEVALLRISTGPLRIPAAAAFDFLQDLYGFPNYGRLSLPNSGLPLWQQLVLSLNLTGNDVNDAYLAPLALTHDLTLVTADRGFTRFAGLRVLTPE